MQFLFVMDPLSRIQRDHDSSFALMLEAQTRGHSIWFSEARDLLVSNALPQTQAQELRVSQQGAPFKTSEKKLIKLSEFDRIWMRTDPPVNSLYLNATRVLELAESQKTRVLNRPVALRKWNEKMICLAFPQLTPASWVGSRVSEARSFVEKTGSAVAKPIEGFAGQEVFRIEKDDTNLNVILESLTQNETQMVMIQEFIPDAIKTGDKRVLWFSGKTLGAFLRKPAPDDHRGNMAKGASVSLSQLDSNEEKVIQTLSPFLEKEGIFFAGIDLIGGKLTEINLTSPTGLQELDRLSGSNSAAKIIEAAENLP